MNELEEKKAALSVMDVLLLPDIPQEHLAENRCQKYPLGNLGALGVAFEPVVGAIQSLTSGAGRSGFYYVNTHGSQMFQFANSSSYMGSLKAANGGVGGGQAALTQLPCNPTMLFMSAALMNLEKKLDDIRALQQDILDYLKAQEKAKLKGDLDVLMDVVSHYKFNCDNERYKNGKYTLVQSIHKDAAQSLNLCQKQIESQLAKKDVLHSDRSVSEKIAALTSELHSYQTALYLDAFSAYLEVLLLDNFDSQYLNSLIEGIQEKAFKFRELYTACYNQIEALCGSSVQSVLTKGVAGLGKSLGKTIAKIPIISKGPVDEALVAAGDKLEQRQSEKSENTMRPLIDSVYRFTVPFVENLKILDRIYNRTAGVLFDKESIYFLAESH